MIVVIYLIIALSLCFTICFAHKEHITNRKLEGKYYTEEWISSRYFWIALSMLIFPITLPAFILSTLLLKIYKPKTKKNEEN